MVWRFVGDGPSLPEANSTVAVPKGGFWLRRLFAFAGPGYMVSVGYMDPGNWATDLAGGVAVRLHAAVRHHAVEPDGDPAAGAGRAARHRHRPRSRPGLPRRLPAARQPRALWSSARLAIIACDLAEVIGTAIALQLLFGIPLIAGVADHRARRVPDAAPDEPRASASSKPSSSRCSSSSPPASRSRSSPPRRRWPALLGGFVPVAGDRHQPGDALHRHRHHRRHGDAAQSLPALLHRADARLRAQRDRPPQRHQVGDARQHHRADAGAVRQRRDPRRRGRGLPRQRTLRRRGDRARPSSCCRRCSGSASPRRCSPSRCLPPASIRR